MPPDSPDPELSTPPFETSLKLTEDQLKRLMEHVKTRLSACCKEMGREKDGRTVGGSWLDKRRLNQLWYEGDMKWREGDTYLGGVFDDSNFTRGDGKRYVRHLAAKITDDLLGTSPFFGALKKDNGKDAKVGLNKAIESYAQEGVEGSNVPDTLREAVELALVRNEAVIKIRNVFQSTGFVGPAEVLVGMDGQPVLTPAKQLYVMKNDDFLPVPGKQGIVALEKDASFEVAKQDQAAFQFATFDDLPQTQATRQWLDGRVIDPRDFICPLKWNSIHEADICAHYYDESPTVLKGLYAGFNMSGSYFGGPESGEKSAIESQGEQPSSGMDEKWVPVGEVYVRFDANEDGQEENILLVMDRDCNGGTALFYDYLENHMKKRPFEVLCGLRKVPGRWYGVGVYTDKFDQLVFVDKTFNRINLKNGKACTVTAVRRDAIEEWSDMKQGIELGGDQVLTLNSKWSADKGEWLEQKRLIEVSAEEVELMQQMLQAMDQEFGYISAADASATGLNQSKTATGIASIERSGNNIVKAVERIHMTGIQAVLEQSVDILLENMDEAALSLTKDAELLTLNRDEIRDMPRDVRLLLTRSRSSELLATNQQALVIANQYFDLLEASPRRAKALRPMYLSQLKALEVQDADDLLPEVTDAMITAVEGAKKPQEQKPESLSISYKDAPKPIRRQMEAKAGMIPLTPEQEAMESAKEAQEEAAKNASKQPPPDEEPPSSASSSSQPKPTPPVLAGSAS